MTHSTGTTDTAPVTWTDASAQVDGVTVQYRSAGSGDVLLVVGSPLEAAVPALDQLAAAYRLVVAELTDGAQSPRDLGSRIAAFVAALDLASVAVLGSGTAATAALWAAVDNPGLVSTLVLEAPSLFSHDDPADPLLVDALPQCEVPTLVLLGQRDPVSSPDFAADYKRLPASTVAIVYAAGADIKGERPAAFSDTVSDYLRRGQAFVLSTASTLIHA